MKDYYNYMPITELEKKWGFYITTVGHAKISPKASYPPVKGHPNSHTFTWNKGRTLNGYYIVFISKGEGILETEYTPPITLSEGSCFFLFPNVWHRYKPSTNTGWEEYWIGFRGTYPENLMQAPFFSPQNPFVNIGLRVPMLALFQRLLEMVQLSYPGYDKIIPGITLEILGLINNNSFQKNLEANPTQKLIQKALFLLQESIDEKVNVKKLAQQLPMGYSKFRKEFKKAVGKSPLEYQLELRLDKAKELLSSTTQTISEIAFQTGFDSVYYFSKFFKIKTGISPKYYRNGLNKSVK